MRKGHGQGQEQAGPGRFDPGIPRASHKGRYERPATPSLPFPSPTFPFAFPFPFLFPSFEAGRAMARAGEAGRPFVKGLS